MLELKDNALQHILPSSISGDATVKDIVQTILPDSTGGYNYLSQVTVEAIPYNESENPQGGLTVTIG